MPTLIKKQSINVTLESDLVQRAKALKVNFSRLLTKAVENEVKALEAEEWKRQNAQAMEDVNGFMAEVGHFSDEHRKF